MDMNVTLKNLLADIQKAVIDKNERDKQKAAQNNGNNGNTNYRLANELDPNDFYGGLISFSTNTQGTNNTQNQNTISSNSNEDSNTSVAQQQQQQQEIENAATQQILGAAIRDVSAGNQDLVYDSNGKPLSGFMGDKYYENGKLYTGPLFGQQYVNGVPSGQGEPTHEVVPDNNEYTEERIDNEDGTYTIVRTPNNVGGNEIRTTYTADGKKTQETVIPRGTDIGQANIVTTTFDKQERPVSIVTTVNDVEINRMEYTYNNENVQIVEIRTFEDGSWAKIEDKAVTLYDSNDKVRMSVITAKTMPEYTVDKDSITLNYGENQIALVEGDTVKIDYAGGITLTNPENGVKIYNLNGVLTAESSLKPGEKGSYEYIRGLLDQLLPKINLTPTIPIDDTMVAVPVDPSIINGISAYNVKFDDDGRITELRPKGSYAVHGGAVMEGSLKYEITYKDNGETEITRTETPSAFYDGYYISIETYTFNENGKLTKKVSDRETTIYEENGDYVTTVVDVDGNPVKTITRTAQEDGTILIETEETNGSWDRAVTDANGKLISKEAVAKVQPEPDSIPINLGEPKNQLIVNDSFGLYNNTSEEIEVRYTINSDGVITVYASGVTIQPSYAKGSQNVMVSRLPDNLTIIGDNNEIIGSFGNDNVKVIGDNNQIDLKDGNDTATTIGNNNNVSNTESFNSRTKEIPVGEVGSKEYVFKLFENDPSLGNYMDTVETDEEGRVTYLGRQIHGEQPNNSVIQIEYRVSYDKNGEITITRNITDKPEITKTFNADGKLIREVSVNESKNPMETVEITYGDGIKTTVTTLGTSDKPVSVEKRYETDDYVSVFKDEYTYYENGNKATHINTITKDGVQLEKVTITYDEGGLITSEQGEINLQPNNIRALNKSWHGISAFGDSIIIANPNEEAVAFTYSINWEGQMEINANGLEIGPNSIMLYDAPWVYFDYATGSTVQFTDEEISSIIAANDEVSGNTGNAETDLGVGVDIANLEDTVSIQWWRPISIATLTNITINGNKNTITGSNSDDEISVNGNNNVIDLKDGNDKLNVVGFNNNIKNVENISANKYNLVDIDGTKYNVAGYNELSASTQAKVRNILAADISGVFATGNNYIKVSEDSNGRIIVTNELIFDEINLPDNFADTTIIEFSGEAIKFYNPVTIGDKTYNISGYNEFSDELKAKIDTILGPDSNVTGIYGTGFYFISVEENEDENSVTITNHLRPGVNVQYIPASHWAEESVKVQFDGDAISNYSVNEYLRNSENISAQRTLNYNANGELLSTVVNVDTEELLEKLFDEDFDIGDFETQTPDGAGRIILLRDEDSNDKHEYRISYNEDGTVTVQETSYAAFNENPENSFTNSLTIKETDDKLRVVKETVTGLNGELISITSYTYNGVTDTPEATTVNIAQGASVLGSVEYMKAKLGFTHNVLKNYLNGEIKYDSQGRVIEFIEYDTFMSIDGDGGKINYNKYEVTYNEDNSFDVKVTDLQNPDNVPTVRHFDSEGNEI